jgi:hypothetical protein
MWLTVLDITISSYLWYSGMPAFRWQSCRGLRERSEYANEPGYWLERRHVRNDVELYASWRASPLGTRMHRAQSRLSHGLVKLEHVQDSSTEDGSRVLSLVRLLEFTGLDDC